MLEVGMKCFEANGKAAKAWFTGILFVIFPDNGDTFDKIWFAGKISAIETYRLGNDELK